jgi:NAD(P)H-hydrate epimerase
MEAAMKLVSVAEMQAVEREADAQGLSYAQMMENAGRGLAIVVRDAHSQLRTKKILGLVGSGNNGGDTLVALTYLAQWGWQAGAYVVRPRPQDDPLVQRLLTAGGEIYYPGSADLGMLLGESRVLLDGVLGTGARLPLKPEVAGPLGEVQSGLSGLAARPVVVAVDCPSGIDCDSGAVAPECLQADLTVTMAAVKQGLLRFPAAGLVGELRLVGIGPIEGLKAYRCIVRSVATREGARAMLPKRPLEAHKGTFGTALIVAGSVNYTGAAWLAGEAAHRVGAGLVTLAAPQPLHAALAGHFPEATWLLLADEAGVIAEAAAEQVTQSLGRATAVLVGPGLGLAETTGRFVQRLLEMGAGRLPPLVFDADGLKLASQQADWPRRLPAETVLTPHPGEMALLSGLSKETLQGERVKWAEHYAREWEQVVVLKGAFTVIAHPDSRTTVIPVATPALARAGTGDVLAGLIVGLRAQGVPAFEAAVAGAWLHAQAGLAAARQLGNPALVLAGDVLQAVKSVLRED